MKVGSNQTIDGMEIQYKYNFNDHGHEGHSRFDMGEDRWGLSKAANHVLPQAACASWTVLVSSTTTTEEGLDIQKFLKSNILWITKVYMLSKITNKI